MGNCWATYSLFVTTLFVVNIFYSFYLYLAKSDGIKRFSKVSKLKTKNFSPTIRFLLLISVFLILIGFWMPFILTRGSMIKEFDFTKTGNIGDTFGGILNPFVSLAAVIVTGLAFYMQYQANEELRKQFKVQQFESQFYEMLKLHKENVNEMEIDNFKGRRVFTELQLQFEFILRLAEEGQLIANKAVAILEIRESDFNSAYDIFFNGFDNDKQNEFESDVNQAMDNWEFYSFMDNIVNNEILYGRDSEMIEIPNDINITQSKHDLLGHYYRHLYMTVKFVVEAFEEHGLLESKDESMKYLKIVRAQLSNSEQIMLFYNWIAGGGNGYGANWENIDSVNGNNKFFSEYNMVKNLSFGSLYQNKFIKEKVRYIYNASKNNSEIFEQDVNQYLDADI